MHDETFLITSGTLRFILGETYKDANVGDYVVVPVGAPHTFANVSDAPVKFFSTFTPAYYVNYFREMAKLSAEGRLNPQEGLSVMLRYATVPYKRWALVARNLEYLPRQGVNYSSRLGQMSH